MQATCSPPSRFRLRGRTLSIGSSKEPNTKALGSSYAFCAISNAAKCDQSPLIWPTPAISHFRNLPTSASFGGGATGCCEEKSDGSRKRPACRPHRDVGRCGGLVSHREHERRASARGVGHMRAARRAKYDATARDSSCPKCASDVLRAWVGCREMSAACAYDLCRGP